MGAYKHVYFNITQNTLVMWCFTVLAVVFVYEATRKVFISLYRGEPVLKCIITRLMMIMTI